MARTIWVRGPHGWEEQPDPYDDEETKEVEESPSAREDIFGKPGEPGSLGKAIPGEGRTHIAEAWGLFTSNMGVYDAEFAPTLTHAAAGRIWIMNDAGFELVKLARKMHREDLARHCRQCRKPLAWRRGAGRQSEFCGDACRAAAYRRREQRLRETLPRVKTGGRLALRDRLRPTSRLVPMRQVRRRLLMRG